MTPSPAQTGAITATAPAKINLTLQICGRRADNYHLLDSLVVFAGAGDQITVSPAHELRLTIAGPFGAALASEPNNLVLRAARFLAAAHNITQGASIVLEKNLPVASGIGGGSADAAATMIACGRLWGVDPLTLADRDIAAALGADVPVCLRGVPAFMSGIGEIIDPAPRLPDTWLVLVNPGVPLATKAVFAALAGRFSAPMARDAFQNLTDAETLAKVLKLYGNDLMPPALEILPAIAPVLRTLEQASGCLLARLSGSGPTCFGVFANARTADQAAGTIGAAHPGWWVMAAPTLKAPPPLGFVS
jgi:4-diphosphocytidyl-2-C-methyl-D-erythritol kinase